MASNIQNFFAKLKLKVDLSALKDLNKELDAIDKKLKDLGKGFKQIDPEVTPKRKTRKKLPKGEQDFVAKDFLESEMMLRNTLGDNAKITAKARDQIERIAKSREKHRVQTKVAVAELKNLVQEKKREVRQNKHLTRSQRTLIEARKRSIASIKQFAFTYISAYTAMAGLQAVNKVGQDIEAAKAGLLSVSDGAEGVARDFNFIRKESQRLGVDIVSSTKDFVKLRAVAGDLSDEDIQGIFTGIAEAGIVTQLSQEDLAGSFRAVQQMLAKGRVNMEDFRQQLAERMPLAIKAMANAAGVSQKEIFDLIETSELGEDVIAKFGIELQKLANRNNALEKALKTTKTAQNQMNNSFKIFLSAIFDSGAGEGLAELFNAIAEFLNNNTGLATVFGSTLKVALTIVSSALRVLTPILSVVSKIFEALNHFTGGWATGLITVAFGIKKVNSMLQATTGIVSVLTKVTKSWQLIILAVIAGLGIVYQIASEIKEFFTGEGLPSLMELSGLETFMQNPIGMPQNNVNNSNQGTTSSGNNIYVDNMEIVNNSDRFTPEAINQEVQGYAV